MPSRLPPSPLRRRPVPPPPIRPIAQLAARTSVNKPSAFPLLPATAAAFVLLGAAQLGFWWWESRLPGIPNTLQRQSNPFVALEQPKATDGSSVREAQRLGAVVLPQNLQFGDAMAHVTVTIFTDPSCGICREKVRAWTASLPVQGVRQVYKFWPQDPTRTTPGMILELARRESLVPAFWRSLQGAGPADLDDSRLLDMLDKAGMPLVEQRKALTDEGETLMTMLEPDMKLGQTAHLPPPPVVMVDDYILDGDVLSPESLGAYVAKRLAGREIMAKDDLWLMRK